MALTATALGTLNAERARRSFEERLIRAAAERIAKAYAAPEPKEK